MKLQTEIPIPIESRNPISYYSKVVLLGSCFAESMGALFSHYKFQSLQNPFGILYHPKAIEQLIVHAINKKVYTQDDVFNLNERWHSFEAHSSKSDPNMATLISSLNKAIEVTHVHIQEATHIFITLGTSWVYRHIETDTVVANCHKVPQKKFLKELLSVSEIEASLNAMIALIKSVNRNASIVFTVSPIRHLRDGFVENQQSKSHLVSAIHKVVDGGRTASYFPSYEIMMDELRDYRFYKEDMIHPNEVAIRYIWNRFTNVWISEDAQQTMKEVHKIQSGLAHRSFHPDSEAHQRFLAGLQQQIDTLKNKHSHIAF